MAQVANLEYPGERDLEPFDSTLLVSADVATAKANMTVVRRIREVWTYISRQRNEAEKETESGCIFETMPGMKSVESKRLRINVEMIRQVLKDRINKRAVWIEYDGSCKWKIGKLMIYEKEWEEFGKPTKKNKD